MVSWLSYTVLGLALLSIGGGIQGYVGAQSSASLMGGVGSGLILIVGLYIAKTKPKHGYLLTALVSLGLGAMMLKRYLGGTGSLWPAGVMAIAGIAVFLAHIVAHFMSIQRKD